MWLCFLALAAAQINPQALYERGQRDAALSRQAFEKLLKIAPESAYVLALLGEVKTQDRQYTAALYAYTEAAKRMPAMRGVRAKSAADLRLSRQAGRKPPPPARPSKSWAR